MTKEIKKEEEKKKVSVTLAFLKGLKKQLESQKEDISILKQVADKKAMARYYARNREKLPPVVGLRALLREKEVKGKRVKEELIVVGWRTTKNDVFKDVRSQKWVEIQEIEVLYENGETEEMSLRDFNRRFIKIPCNRIGVITDEVTDEIAFKLARQDNGKEYVVGVQYVN